MTTISGDCSALKTNVVDRKKSPLTLVVSSGIISLCVDWYAFLIDAYSLFLKKSNSELQHCSSSMGRMRGSLVIKWSDVIISAMLNLYNGDLNVAGLQIFSREAGSRERNFRPQSTMRRDCGAQFIAPLSRNQASLIFISLSAQGLQWKNINLYNAYLKIELIFQQWIENKFLLFPPNFGTIIHRRLSQTESNTR